MKPKVGIIGIGNVGTALKRGLDRAGYDTKTTGNEPELVKTIAEWADMVILSVPFMALDNILSEIGGAVDGKVLVDVTNLYTPEMLSAAGSKSGAELLQEKAPNSKVVKAFNMHFARNMESGSVGNEKITLLASGNDKQAREKVLEIARDMGYDAVDAGGLENARLLENLGLLTIRLGYELGLGTNIGFKLVRG